MSEVDILDVRAEAAWLAEKDAQRERLRQTALPIFAAMIAGIGPPYCYGPGGDFYSLVRASLDLARNFNSFVDDHA